MENRMISTRVAAQHFAVVKIVSVNAQIFQEGEAGEQQGDVRQKRGGMMQGGE
jgi:hypothetical protein